MEKKQAADEQHRRFEQGKEFATSQPNGFN
jgi:hypothetical protein